MGVCFHYEAVAYFHCETLVCFHSGVAGDYFCEVGVAFGLVPHLVGEDLSSDPYLTHCWVSFSGDRFPHSQVLQD